MANKRLQEGCPLPQGQQCLPISIFKSIYDDKSSPLHIALGQLILGALFFTCCSCEYSKGNNDENRKNKILALENLNFFSKNIKKFTMSTIFTRQTLFKSPLYYKNGSKTTIYNATQEFIQFLPCQNLDLFKEINHVLQKYFN